MPQQPIRQFPISKFNRSRKLQTLAYPGLFVTSASNYATNRIRKVLLAQQAAYLIRFNNPRFAQHRHFRFNLFNTIKRQQARRQSTIIVKQLLEQREIIRKDLEAIFATPDDINTYRLLSSITRQAANIKGSRPYQFGQRRELIASIRTTSNPNTFTTTSTTNLQQEDLQRYILDYNKQQDVGQLKKVRII